MRPPSRAMPSVMTRENACTPPCLDASMLPSATSGKTSSILRDTPGRHICPNRSQTPQHQIITHFHKLLWLPRQQSRRRRWRPGRRACRAGCAPHRCPGSSAWILRWAEKRERSSRVRTALGSSGRRCQSSDGWWHNVRVRVRVRGGLPRDTWSPERKWCRPRNQQSWSRKASASSHLRFPRRRHRPELHFGCGPRAGGVTSEDFRVLNNKSATETERLLNKVCLDSTPSPEMKTSETY